jgi:polar amino acid transport system substrate-binding protein
MRSADFSWRSLAHRLLALGLGLALLLGAADARADKLRVYTKPVEPFSFQQEGKAAGFSIELWDRIAKETGQEYELHWTKSVAEIISAVKNGDADIGVAAISITAERERVVDFSQPFYESGLSILVSAQGQSSLSVIGKSLFTPDFVKLLGVVLLILAITGHLIWLFERKRNPEQFPEPYFKGVWESSWWAISTILSGGCDAKGPNALGGRIVGAAWMLVCIVFITYFTASITTIMTVNQLTSDINGPRDLPGKTVATVQGSTAETYLKSIRVAPKAFPTIDAAFAALAKKQVQAVVYDSPMLLYHLKSAPPQEQVVGGLFQRQNYGIAMPPGSPQRKTINEALLKLRETGVLDDLNTKWFGKSD